MFEYVDRDRDGKIDADDVFAVLRALAVLEERDVTEEKLMSEAVGVIAQSSRIVVMTLTDAVDLYGRSLSTPTLDYVLEGAARLNATAKTLADKEKASAHPASFYLSKTFLWPEDYHPAVTHPASVVPRRWIGSHCQHPAYLHPVKLNPAPPPTPPTTLTQSEAKVTTTSTTAAITPIIPSSTSSTSSSTDISPDLSTSTLPQTSSEPSTTITSSATVSEPTPTTPNLSNSTSSTASLSSSTEVKADDLTTVAATCPSSSGEDKLEVKEDVGTTNTDTKVTGDDQTKEGDEIGGPGRSAMAPSSGTTSETGDNKGSEEKVKSGTSSDEIVDGEGKVGENVQTEQEQLEIAARNQPLWTLQYDPAVINPASVIPTEDIPITTPFSFLMY